MKRKIDDLGRISLPAEMKKEIGLNNGSEANIEIEDHKIIITKPNAIDYKAIVDKAIEYVENDKYEYTPMGITNKPINKVLLDILKGNEQK